MKKILGTISIEKANAYYFATRLRQRREQLKLSQRKFAELSGIKQPMIARIEEFKSIPRLDTFIRLTMALDYYIDFIDLKEWLEND